MRWDTRWFAKSCNSHYVSQFAASFIVARAKISVVESCFNVGSIVPQKRNRSSPLQSTDPPRRAHRSRKPVRPSNNNREEHREHNASGPSSSLFPLLEREAEPATAFQTTDARTLTVFPPANMLPVGTTRSIHGRRGFT
eukprot:scaffold52_cov526-Pavlova_lutheri.AAC.3